MGSEVFAARAVRWEVCRDSGWRPGRGAVATIGRARRDHTRSGLFRYSCRTMWLIRVALQNYWFASGPGITGWGVRAPPSIGAPPAQPESYIPPSAG